MSTDTLIILRVMYESTSCAAGSVMLFLGKSILILWFSLIMSALGFTGKTYWAIYFGKKPTLYLCTFSNKRHLPL